MDRHWRNFVSMARTDTCSINFVVRADSFEQNRLRALVLDELEYHPQVISRAASPRPGKLAFKFMRLELWVKRILREQLQHQLQFRRRLRLLAVACEQTGGRNERMPWTARAAVSSKDTFDDSRGRGWTATTRLEFQPRRLYRCDQFCPAVFCQTALEHFHERLLLFKREFIGRIQNLCELCHRPNIADRPALGNHDFDKEIPVNPRSLQIGGESLPCRMRR